MTNEAHIRIDEGIPRPDRETRRRMRQEARRQPVSKTGQFASPYSQEQRQAAIDAVPDAIRRGMSVRELAVQLNIPPSTLKAWVLGNERAEEARGQMIAAELAAKIGEIDDATEPLALARGREGFRAWSWIAERRESRLYGQKQEISHNITGLSDALAAISQARLTAQQQPNQIIDVQPDAVQHIESKEDKPNKA